MDKIRVIVTGATGFVGKHLIMKLRTENFEITEVNTKSGDIADEATWSNLPPVEVVIHLAALTFVPDSWNNTSGFMKTNLMGSVCALNYCKKYNVKLVFLSSYLYGNPETLPIPEWAPIQATNPYALTKKLAEEVCKFYSDNFGVKVTILRPFNVYGSGQSNHFLIPSIIEQTLAGKTIQVKALDPKRDYIYVEDLVNAILKSIQLDQRFNIFNIGTGISYSVAELINFIQRNLNTDLDVRSSGERRHGEIMDTKADITHAKAVLDWEPEFSLELGIVKLLSEMGEGEKA